MLNDSVFGGNPILVKFESIIRCILLGPENAIILFTKLEFYKCFKK